MIIKEISAKETCDLWKQGKIKLLDVRPEVERALSKIEGVFMIDQKMVQEIIDTWPKDTAIVFHCHHGVRSLSAASFFASQGFTNVKSMAGGIEAWSKEVDPSVPLY